jgi:hypothetical protein
MAINSSPSLVKIPDGSPMSVRPSTCTLPPALLYCPCSPVLSPPRNSNLWTTYNAYFDSNDDGLVKRAISPYSHTRGLLKPRFFSWQSHSSSSILSPAYLAFLILFYCTASAHLFAVNVGLAFMGKGSKGKGGSMGWMLIVIYSWISREEATSYFLFLQNKPGPNQL